jgi:two-component system sensor histidine kinase/response regulator
MKILIIEDDLEIRNSLRDMLEIHGHAVTDAADGLEGVRLAKSFLPDLIFCDIAMPAMGGYEVITTIRQHPPCCETPFIFLTARANRADQRHGMSLGADDYITKPFSEKEILDAIAARLRRQQPSRERVARLLAERKVVADAPWSHELMTPLCGILAGAARAAAEEKRADDLVVRCEPGSVPVSESHLLAVVAELVSSARGEKAQEEAFQRELKRITESR